MGVSEIQSNYVETPYGISGKRSKQLRAQYCVSRARWVNKLMTTRYFPKSIFQDTCILYTFTADACQPWTDSRDCYFEYLIIHFDYLIIPFDYLITGQAIANFYLQ